MTIAAMISAARSASQLAGGQRHRNVVAWMPAKIAGLGVDVVVEVENAHQRAVGERGVGRAGLARWPITVHCGAPALASTTASRARADLSVSAAKPQPMLSSRRSLA